MDDSIPDDRLGLLYFVSCVNDKDHSQYDERPHIGRLLNAPPNDPQAQQVGVVSRMHPGASKLLAPDFLRAQGGLEMIYLRLKGQYLDGVRMDIAPRDERLNTLVGAFWVEIYTNSANMTLVPSSASSESGTFARLHNNYGKTA